MHSLIKEGRYYVSKKTNIVIKKWKITTKTKTIKMTKKY